VGEIRDLDEGSWIYLSLGEADLRVRPGLREQVIEVCESSGWPAVSWSPPLHREHDVSRFFEGMDHAVEHADVVIVLLEGDSAVADAELASALKHRRPVIGLSFAAGSFRRSAVQASLSTYARGRVVECADVDDCVSGLREALTDRSFGVTIHEAASEGVGYV
jgi:DNA-binding NarL/FixJ family response regulator